MGKTRYKVEGYEKGAYVVCEYNGPTPVYYFKGFYKGGDYFDLYPSHAVVKGERRDKIRVSVRDVER